VRKYFISVASGFLLAFAITTTIFSMTKTGYFEQKVLTREIMPAATAAQPTLPMLFELMAILAIALICGLLFAKLIRVKSD